MSFLMHKHLNPTAVGKCSGLYYNHGADENSSYSGKSLFSDIFWKEVEKWNGRKCQSAGEG